MRKKEEQLILASSDEGDIMPIFSVQGDEHDEDPKEDMPSEMPLLALRNTVLFPTIMIPINIGRDSSFKAIQYAYKHKMLIGVLTQKNADIDEPEQKDLYTTGTSAKILKLLKMPDGSTTAIIQGRTRFELHELTETQPFLRGLVKRMDTIVGEKNIEFDALTTSIREKAMKIIQLAPHIPSEAGTMLDNIKSDQYLINFIASNLNGSIEDKQSILEQSNLELRAASVFRQLDRELQLLQIKDKIENKTRNDIEKQQRDYFLNQQMKTIQKELGQNPQESDLKKLQDRADKMDWPEYAAKTFAREMERLRRMNPQVAEYSVALSYLELILDLPWNARSQDSIELKKVSLQLNKDHFGLEKVKERILEHLAVLKLKGDMKSPILCLVGPPGVGKTSLGKSIADALGRKYVRMSFGGLHDESEIRGHRKTYIGAMPGRIIQNIKKAGTSNPVFILDEIDKIGRDFRGDPSSALLEVLDPEQNTTFHDNYLDMEYDLSKVLFIATANSLATIQKPLLDRMEIIQVNGYSTHEKAEIAKKYLLPKQLKNHGLKRAQLQLDKKALTYLIENYTRESGVRGLDRAIAKIARKRAKQVAMEEEIVAKITIEEVMDRMGPEIHKPDIYEEARTPGVAIGLAWTSTGGDILFIESSLSKGKGRLTLTGNLGDVMKESATTALSFVKANSTALGIDTKYIADNDIHIHVPEGAIPKDGPSAGITMLTTLASAYTGKAVKPFLAMSGEITLRGKVLPVGGIKAKLLAAKRAGIKEVLLSSENKRHVAEINNQYLKGMKITFVESMTDVLIHALK